MVDPGKWNSAVPWNSTTDLHGDGRFVGVVV